MKRPTKIRIMGIDYSIEYVGRKCDVDTDDQSALFGQIRYDECAITVASCRREELMRITLMHEVIHAIDRHFRMELTESTTGMIAEGLCQVMADNGGRLTG